ncbi:MAG TPA: hypothetical protein VG227_08435 [Caulobacteraceae bacterium]|jgi:hypothetical protein|nr:hypothetical protein [Caulobacteraceae bacterium]
MDEVSRAICFAGLAMFVFGLAIGFCLKALPNPRAGFRRTSMRCRAGPS